MCVVCVCDVSVCIVCAMQQGVPCNSRALPDDPDSQVLVEPQPAGLRTCQAVLNEEAVQDSHDVRISGNP